MKHQWKELCSSESGELNTKERKVELFDMKDFGRYFKRESYRSDSKSGYERYGRREHFPEQVDQSTLKRFKDRDKEDEERLYKKYTEDQTNR